MNMELVQAQMAQIMAIIGKQFEESIQRYQQQLDHNPEITRAVTELRSIKAYHDEDVP